MKAKAGEAEQEANWAQDLSVSYDLMIKLDQFNEVYDQAWTWMGEPMRTMAAIDRRLAKEQKAYGERFLAYKITRTTINVRTGEIEFAVVAEG